MNMNDMTGWVPIGCSERDYVLDGSRPLSAASTLTDLDGTYGPPIIFTEWWLDDQPVLRDYLDNPHSDEPTCRHYVWDVR